MFLGNAKTEINLTSKLIPLTTKVVTEPEGRLKAMNIILSP